MLVVHPDSLCDICLDGFSTGMSAPHSINCGHIFCFACLQCVSRPQCPLCRKPFDMSEVRKLHTDKAAASPKRPFSAVVDDCDSECSEPTRYRLGIARIIEQGCSGRTLLEKLDELAAWLRTQPPEQHFDIRMSHRILRQRYKDAQTHALQKRELQQTVDDLKSHALLEREEAQDKYDALVQTCQNERETARAMQKSLHEHRASMERQWKSKYDTLLEECHRLRGEIERLSPNRLPTPPHEAEWFSGEAYKEDGFRALRRSPPPSALSIAMANSNQDDFMPIPTTPTLPDDLPDFAPIPTDDECGKLQNIDVLLGNRRTHANRSPTVAAALRLDLDPATSQSVPRTSYFPEHLSSSPTRLRSKSIHTSSHGAPDSVRQGTHRRRDSREERYDDREPAFEQRRAQLNELLERPPRTPEQPSPPESQHRMPTRRTERRRSHSPDAVVAPEPTYSYPSLGYPLPSPKLPRSRPTTAASTPYPPGEQQPRAGVISASSAAFEAERQRTGSYVIPGLGRPAYLRRDSTSSLASNHSSAKTKPLDRYPTALGVGF